MLPLKRKLYSHEFRQCFKTDGTVYTLKENSDGNLEFKIGEILYVSQFRRKKDEFMEALGLPTRGKIEVLSCKSK